MKRNCIIFGSGRSGTSLAAGLLADAGYFMGEQLYAADDGNPKGYFEDHEVNGINEGLLAQLLPGPKRKVIDQLLCRPRPRQGWTRWLADLPAGTLVKCPPEFARRISALTGRAPFCFKDPRFCYTLSAWRPFISGAVLICVFRDPGATAASIIKQAKRAENLKGLALDHQFALKVWLQMYRNVLQVHYPVGGDWLFVHYDQLLSGAAIPRLEQELGVQVNREFADVSLRRSAAVGPVPEETAITYRELCRLAGHTEY
jgi:hypothetical protein